MDVKKGPKVPLGLSLSYSNVVSDHPAVLDNNDYRGTIFTVSILLMVCTSVAVSSRLTRSWQAQTSFELHDVFIVCAGICAFIMSTGCAHLTTDGLGMHDYNNQIAQNGHFQKLVIAVNVFYFSCNFFVKVALLQMYRKFTRTTWGSVLIIFMCITSTMFWIGSILATVLQCLPLSAIWDWTILEGWCIDLSMFYISNASIMIGMDVILYAIPVFFTYKLRMPRGKKIGLNVLFGMGTIVLTASAVRLWIVHQAVSEGDLSYNYGRSLLVSQVENHMAIVIACAPAIRYVFKQVGKHGFFQVKDALNSSRGKFGKLFSSAASSAPNSPSSDRFPMPLPTPEQASFRLPKSRRISTLGSIFDASSKPVTQASSNKDDDRDLELGFHDTTCEYVPTITTTIIAGGAPPRPPSQKNKLYITREMTVTEQYANSSECAQSPLSESDRASLYSSLSTDTTDVTSMDLAALPMPSPQPSKENFTDEDGVMRKEFAEIMNAHMGTSD